MDIQILVPQYEEDESIVRVLLDSIAKQEGTPLENIGVIICNDGSDVILSEEFLDSYPFRIDYHIEPHRGVSGTRNACLDYAEADYVMFCDADDKFFNDFGLWIISTEIGNGFDVLVSRFVEEVINFNGNKPEFINHDNDTTFVHGKVFNRKFLVENNIRFCDKLTIHEDGYFNILAQRLSQKTIQCTTSFYLWKWRDESVCRRDPDYRMSTLTNLVDSSDALVKEFYHRGLRDQAVNCVASSMLDYYYTMNRQEWYEPEHAKYKSAADYRIARYYKKYRRLWESATVGQLTQLSEEARRDNVTRGMQMEMFTFGDWMKYIDSLTV